MCKNPTKADGVGRCLTNGRMERAMKRERKRRLGTNSHNRVPSICVLLDSHCGANRASSWCGYICTEARAPILCSTSVQEWKPISAGFSPICQEDLNPSYCETSSHLQLFRSSSGTCSKSAASFVRTVVATYKILPSRPKCPCTSTRLKSQVIVLSLHTGELFQEKRR